MATTTTHVVVLPYPAQGHLSPVLHLCRRLAAQGLLVTIVNVESIHRQLLESWKPVAGIRLKGVPFELDIPFGYDAQCQAERGKFYHYAHELQGKFEEVVSEFEPPPSCILADDMFLWPKATAEKLGVPSVCYWPGNATWNSVQFHLALLVSNDDLPLKDGNKLVDYLPGATPIKVKHLPEYYHHLEKSMLEHLCNARQAKPDFVLVNSFYELEPLIFDDMREELGPRYVSVGPLFPLDLTSEPGLKTSLREEDLSCMKWLDEQPRESVLYISFGSCSAMSKSEFEEFTHGLAASKQPFLWVLRPDLVGVMDETEIYDTCKERLQDQGWLVPWVPQLKVLSHPSVGGFVTHCGWNSIFESISYGVPMLGFPRHSDQSLNCKLMVEDWKIGRRLAENDGTLERAEVTKVVEEFMDKERGKAARLAAQKLKEAARAAALPGGSSYNNIDNFVEQIRTYS